MAASVSHKPDHIATSIDSVTRRVLGTAFPSEITPAADGSGCAVTWRSPSQDSTRLYTAAGVEVAVIPGARPVCWFQGGFVTDLAGVLKRWSLEESSVEDLGSWTDRSVAATVREDLWMVGSGGSLLSRHSTDGRLAREIRFHKRLLGSVVPSADGGLVALRLIEEAATSSLRVLTREGEEVLQWSEPGWCVLKPAFAGDRTLVVTRMRADSLAREIVCIDVTTGEREVLVRETSDKGFVKLPSAVAAIDSVAYLRYEDGWPLLCHYDLRRCREVVFNPGPHEDLTDVDDAPVFSPDSSHLAFNSSAADLRERHLYVYETQSGSVTRTSFEPGATGAKQWLGNDRLVFVESHALTGVRLRWKDLNGERSVEVRPGLEQPNAINPSQITLRGGSHPVPADLYLPRDHDSGRSRPALVYAHGGVFRQLTRGYPASYAYTLLHEINLGLLELGFVVMSVEYRGSMGFGLAHDQANHLACGVADTEDCARAAEHLATLPFVDPARIGIWGLSWGGTMTLQALVRYPELFAAGVNMAGIWDFEQRAHYWNALQVGQPIYFDGRMGPTGSEVRRQASARTLVDRLQAPLLSLHGTADESVDFAQQDLLLADAESHGKQVRSLTFDGEAHVFRSAKAWERAVPEILGFLCERLGAPE